MQHAYPGPRATGGHPASRRTFATPLLLAAVFLVVLGGCRPVPHSNGSVPGDSHACPEVSTPRVERDLDAIRAEGVLRMITRPGPTSFLVYDGDLAGFEYELVAAFARAQGLRLEVVLPRPGEDPISLLNQGAGDLVAAGLTASPLLERCGSVTQPYGYTRQRLILPAGDDRPDTVTALAGMSVHVPAHSQVLQTLRDIQNRLHLRFSIVKAAGDPSQDDLIAAVAAGRIPATVANENVALAAMANLPGARLGAALTGVRPNVWLLRANSPRLRESVDRFLARQYRMLATAPRRSRIYGILEKRYFIDPEEMARYRRPESRPDRSGVISPWDGIVREACVGTGLDWVLVTALMYEESRFLPTARSNAGAVGLMQMMPRFSPLDSAQVFDPTENIRAGVRRLHEIYRGYAYLDSLDRLAFTTATYHSGYGHMNDARRLTMDAGLDPNRWRDNVEVGLQRKRERRHYPDTRYGFYRGNETVDYVRDIFYRHRLYRHMLDRWIPPDGRRPAWAESP